jgi:D-alanyl-D-alanine carboxypeptidase
VRRLAHVPVATALICAVLSACLAGAAVAATSPPPQGGKSCGAERLRVSSGCVSYTAARDHIVAMVRSAVPELGLRATLLRIHKGRESVVNTAVGNSMKGEPASPRMYWRIGAIAIPYLINLLLELEDEGKLSLDDKLSEYRPELPAADRITLRMLASSTSGYPDFIQGNPPFQALLFENPFRQFSPDELIQWAFTLPNVCAPGSCFHYAHTNFAILSQVVSQVGGNSVEALVKERIFGPLRLRRTQISRYPAFPGIALHSYTGERGVYEDATFWSPSWSIGEGTVMTATMGDAVRGFREMASGALISKRANRERTAPITAGMPPFTPKLHYALGVLVANGWQLQNPFINGYTGIAAHLPAKDLSLAIVTTQLPANSANGVSYATILFSRLTKYLSPANAVVFPGL